MSLFLGGHVAYGEATSSIGEILKSGFEVYVEGVQICSGVNEGKWNCTHVVWHTLQGHRVLYK